MPDFFLRKSILTPGIAVLFLAACGSGPVLLSKDARVPSGIDLSGYWALQLDANSRARSRPAGEEKIVIPPERYSRTARRPPDSGPTVQVFLEYGDELKISQTDFGLFISYDRSVVEEYTFGENRVVEIGPIEARRVSGWEGTTFVVETLDDRGTILSEQWRLDGDGETLVRQIRISKGERETYAEKQTFDRR